MEVVAVGAKETAALLGDLSAQMPKAVSRALNRSIGSARTLMARSVAKDIGLNVGTVRERIRVYEASPDRLSARLETSTKRLPLIDFKAKGPEPSRGKGRGVSYRFGSINRRIDTAFIATMASGHRGVFKREEPSRLPIKELFGPSLGRVFLKFVKDVRARANEQFEKTLLSELKFRRGRS